MGKNRLTRRGGHKARSSRRLGSGAERRGNAASSTTRRDMTRLLSALLLACPLGTATLWLPPTVRAAADATKAVLVVGACSACLFNSPTHALATARTARPSAADRTATYARSAEQFVGGYTVAGTKLSISPGKAPGATESFTVGQECICSAKATENGIFASGANPENAFLLVATLSDAGDEWTAEQTSVGVSPPYKATMKFGATAGGAHTAIGSTLTSSGESTAFSAQQSAMGCTEGEGAAACEAVCGKYALPWDMVRQRCGLTDRYR